MERELTSSWAVIVPPTNYFAAFVNRAEGEALVGQAHTFLCLYIFLSHFHYMRIVLYSQLLLSEDVVNLLLLHIYLLDLCLCDMYLQWAEG